jgi:hypothetical protein
LRSALETSGLFYEAHLREWTEGSRTLAQLRQEPQAAASPAQVPDAEEAPTPVRPAPAADAGATLRALPAPAAPTAAPTGAPALTESGVPARLAGPPLPASPDAATDSQTPWQREALPPSTGPAAALHGQQAALAYLAMSASETATPAPHPLAHAAATLPPQDDNTAPAMARPLAAVPDNTPAIHPDTAALVRQQLEALASQQLHWSGEAWPGTRMDWRIAREREAPEHAQAGAEGAWTTRLVLEFPNLGTVEAQLRLTGSGVQARLLTPQAGVAEQLAANGRAFGERLSAAGLMLTALAIDATPGMQDSTGDQT